MSTGPPSEAHPSSPPSPGAPAAAVRLDPGEIAAIRRAAEAHFGPGVRVWLFGSRTDPGRRGGDIDLYLEPDRELDDLLGRELRLHADLQRALGEQRIDLVVHPWGRPLRPIDREARRTGVPL